VIISNIEQDDQLPGTSKNMEFFVESQSSRIDFKNWIGKISTDFFDEIGAMKMRWTLPLKSCHFQELVAENVHERVS